MIICADLNMSDQGHVPFNSAMLSIICDIYIEDTVLFIAEKKHINNVKKNLQEKEITYVNKIQNVSGKGFSIFIKQFNEVLNLFKILYLYNKNDARVLVLFSVFPLVHYFIKIIKKVYPKIHLIIILHGELEHMREVQRPNVRFFGKILKMALNIKNDKNTYYLVLGEIIKKNLVGYLNISGHEVISIDHPYRYENIINSGRDFARIQIAMIGVANIYKNAQMIFQLGRDLECFISNNQLELSIIGSLEKSMFPYLNDKVKYLDSNRLIPRSDFEEAVKQIDYAVFFYDNNYYKMCASGAIFDAIKFEKPIISIKNDFLEYYFSILGNIGYLCESYKELMQRVSWIIENKPVQEYQIQVNNLKLAKQYLSLDSIAIRFTKELKQKDFY